MPEVDHTWDQPRQPDAGSNTAPVSPDAAGNLGGSPSYTVPRYAPGAHGNSGFRDPAIPFARPPVQQPYQQGQQAMRRKITTPRMTGYRIACGVCWAVWVLAFFIGAVTAFAGGNVGTGLVCLILAGLSAWYDIRIWTLKARRLTFFIIF